MTAAAAVARSLGIGGIAIEGDGAVRCSPLVSGRSSNFRRFFFYYYRFASHLGMDAVQCQDGFVSAAYITTQSPS